MQEINFPTTTTFTFWHNKYPPSVSRRNSGIQNEFFITLELIAVFFNNVQVGVTQKSPRLFIACL
jgi:hypothetical protein